MLPGACHLWCEQNIRHNKISPLCFVRKNTVSLDVNVRMGWFIYHYQKVAYIAAQIVSIYGDAMKMRTKRQHSRNLGYGGVTNATLRSNNQLLQQQPHAYKVAG